jgi:hypothetical protein
MIKLLSPLEIQQKKIIFSCFDWGFGHVSRSIPLIIQLENQGNKVLFVGEAAHIQLLKQYGFEGQVLQHVGSDLKFKGSGNFIREGLLNLFKGPAFIRRDLKLVRKLVASFSPDFIISDHRYGFRSKKVTSIFCAHQVELPTETPFLVQSMHRNWVNQFSGVWIFDNEQERLAGELSTSNEKSIYIGHYSRFQLCANVHATIPGKKVAIISGPEPYNKQLLDLITKLSTRFATKITIVCPELMVTVNDSTIDYIHDWLEADSAILAAEWVISRNGYSTLMDIKQLQKKALLLATPGQLEQAYFAEVNNFSQQGVHQVVDETAFEKQWELLFNSHAS